MKIMKLAIFPIALVLIIMTSPVFSQPAKPAPAGEPIKIGGSLPLTGLASEQAKWVKAGYEAWADDVNKKGGLLGRPVKLIIYDDESSPDKAVTYYERAITVDKVDLVYGGYPGTSNVALMPLAEKYGKVFVGQGGHMKSFEQGFTYSFGSPPLMGEWADISVAGLFDDLIPKAQWPKTAAILTMNNVIGLSHVPNILKVFEKNGVKVVVNETYNLPLSDASPLVSKAKGRNAEVLILPSLFDDTVMIMRAAKAQRYNPTIIWNILASRIPAWFKELGADGNYVLANTWWTPDLPYPGNDRIKDAAKRLGLPQAPDFFGLGYIWMYSLEVGVQGAATLDNKKIRDYLRSRAFDLPYGKGIRFDAKGLPAPFCFTVQAANGKNELIWPKDVGTAKLMYPRPGWAK
ncbi:MAG TPA: amino acid ABC transporter substrate-binding protein [Syntrophorhabdales bacterium]|nr:amino acid ABC transporter substrate-binding protein [Syntrophorhabdales bacterium]